MFFKYVPTKPNQTKHGELNNSIVVCLGKVLRITSLKEKVNADMQVVRVIGAIYTGDYSVPSGLSDRLAASV